MKLESDVTDLRVTAPVGRCDHRALRFRHRREIDRSPDKWRRSYKNINVEAFLRRAAALQ